MRIDCPNCSAKYNVRDHLLPPGKATRCSACGHKWIPVPMPVIVAPPPPVPEPEAPPPPPAPVQEPEEPPPPRLRSVVPPPPTAMERLSAASPKPRGKLGLRLAWVATLLLLIGSGVGLWVQRSEVVMLWPPSVRLYSMFGVAPTPETPHPTTERK